MWKSARAQMKDGNEVHGRKWPLNLEITTVNYNGKWSKHPSL